MTHVIILKGNDLYSRYSVNSTKGSNRSLDWSELSPLKRIATICCCIQIFILPFNEGTIGDKMVFRLLLRNYFTFLFWSLQEKCAFIFWNTHTILQLFYNDAYKVYSIRIYFQEKINPLLEVNCMKKMQSPFHFWHPKDREWVYLFILNRSMMQSSWG